MYQDLEQNISEIVARKYQRLQNASLLYLCWQVGVDIVFALCGLLVLLLLLPMLALAIYLDSPGPLFYTQERVGYQGKKFLIYKFRSMRVDAESGGPAWAAEEDTRVTRVGKFMRAIHLDELPQVVNILRREMSLIGPRPEREVFTTELAKVLPLYTSRLGVKPGLTGWAQVKYSYGRSYYDAEIKLQYDLYYIEHQSCKLDLCIIWLTVIEILFCRGT